MEGQAEAVTTFCPTNQHATPQIIFPKGLVGTKSTGQVKIKGSNFHCLFDTGSQVTTVTHSFYNTYLSDHEIKPLNNLLEVEGANGQAVPYLGYVEMEITFPEEFLGKSEDVSTLALVVPDLRTSQPPVLIGTNTLDVVYNKSTPRKFDFRPVPCGYKAVLNILERRQKLTTDDFHGILKLQNTSPKTIHGGETVVMEALAIAPVLQGEKSVLIQHPTSFVLPGGLMIKSCLVDVPASQPCYLPLVLTNESDHDVILPARANIAELCAFHSIICKEQSVRPSAPLNTTESKLNYNFADSPISAEWKQRIIAKLDDIPEVFARHDLDFGCTDKVKHQIKLADQTPFKQRPRPIHPQDLDAVKQHLKELLESGVIRESESPFASPIVVVRKKNGSVRLCIDYRKLNTQTIKDAYPLPKLEDTFMALSGSKWFSVLDLKSGYYQIEMEESDKCKTAFVCPVGFWEFNRMPQGVTNAPSTFQRLMEKCMSGINLREALVFIDDLIVFAPTLEEHEERLMKVLERLKEFGLKLSVEKCVFFQPSVRYLGHVVSQNGVETDPDKIATLTSWPVPKNLKELRSFLGFSGYYRRFVKDYSKIVKPLNELTSGYPPTQKKCKPSLKPQIYLNPKEPFGGRWSTSCQAAFEAIIQKLTSAPVLAFADPSKPYILHTDASCTGLGAVLYQEHEGKKRVVAYASRGLSRSEARYSAHKLEFLALKWAVTEKFNDYLYGTEFTVVTDSNPLTYLLTSAKLDATSYRWLSAISTYSFKITYRAGTQNADADGLSRRPHTELPDDHLSQKERERIIRFTKHHLDDSSSVSIDQQTVHAFCDRQLVYGSTADDQVVALVQALSTDPESLPDSYVDDSQFASPVMPAYSTDDMAVKQRADPVIQHIIALLEGGESPPTSLREHLPDLPLLLRELTKMELQTNVLVRRRQMGDEITFQLVLPEECRSEALHQLHDQMGHLGIERTLDLVRSRFYWPRMSADVHNKIKTCERCVRRKTQPDKAAPLVNIKTTRPLELVCMDFLSLEPDRSKTRDILVITDHFTKYAVAVPTPNQKAKTVAKSLWDNFLVHYGIPEKLHSDQGPDFESRTIKELCAMAEITKTRTTPYHPRGNPVERFNRTLLDMLGTLNEQAKTHWRDFVKPLVHAYNCTRNDVTGFSPYELMFGRQPRLPIDLAFGLPLGKKAHSSHSQYVETLKSHLEESYKIALENAGKVMQRNKTRFDKNITVSELAPGDRVLVKNVRVRGKHKIADRWENEVYIVTKRAGSLPVYTVKPENKDRPVRTLHRDLLLPCGFLSTPAMQVKQKLTQSHDSQTCPKSSLDDADGSEEELTLDSSQPSSEPVTFTTVLELPTPGPVNSPTTSSESPVNQPGQLVQVPTDKQKPVNMSSNEQSVVAEPEAVVQHPETELQRSVDNEVPEKTYPSTHLNPEPVINEPLETLASEAETSEPPRSVSESDSHESEGNSSQESDPPPRRPTRMRRPPERLNYSQLGHPFLHSIQSLFHGLSIAFNYALDPVEPHPAPVSESAVCCQPAACTRPYMSSGGEHVARTI